MCQCSCGRSGWTKPVPFFEGAAHLRSSRPAAFVVEHHEGQSAIAFEGMAVVEVDDGGMLPVFEPVVAGDLAVVLVDLAVAVFPGVELAGRQFEPGEEGFGGGFGAVGPVADVVDHGVAGVMGNPASL